MKKRIMTTLAGFGLALGAAAAGAAHFTFDVPVELSNVHPDITQAHIYCAAARYPLTDGRFAGAERISNMVGQSIPLRDGAYRGTITVAVNALVGKPPASANGYECYLSFYSSTLRTHLSGDDIFTHYPAVPGSYPKYRLQDYFPGVRR